MSQYITRRLIQSLFLLLGVTILVFFMADALPGDVLGAMIQDDMPMSEEELQLMRKRVGLDDPLHVQYAKWIGQVVQGNMGYSFVTGIPIARTVAQRLPATLELMGLSLLLSILLGITLGTLSALHPYSALDVVLTVLSLLGRSVPVFFLGMLLIYTFALRLGWLPVAGRVTAGIPFSLHDHLHHLMAPVLSLSVIRTAGFTRYARASVLDVLNSEYLVVARAKGLPERRVLLVHAMRNALIPIITLIGLNLPRLVGGAVIIETVFQWPGLGYLFVLAVTKRDMPMIMGLALISAVAVFAANLLTDIAYAVADPRIRYEE